ncbi:hypothetical protein [Acinetobacter pittii]|uniref:hypothetical protein n=1 Tax=Acinetobacter pittii TaxID=48296 RepID=UPI0021CD20ED|nr:hypothetical protein [Acinetobacter pittii]MCU4709969.1 hypothetical protein [Acinetobacter pittii]
MHYIRDSVRFACANLSLFSSGYFGIRIFKKGKQNEFKKHLGGLLLGTAANLNEDVTSQYYP